MAFKKLTRRAFHFWFLLRRPMTLGVRIIVEDDDGRILLVRHTYTDGWYLPGGGVERGETQVQSAIKELREEAGIEALGQMELLGVYWNRNVSPRDHVSLFRCAEWRQAEQFLPNREIAEIGFFSRQDLPADATIATRARIAEVFDGQSVSEVW